MNADILGALENINKSYKLFEHNGSRLSKEQVRKILYYGIRKGYKTTNEFLDSEIDDILKEKKIENNQTNLL
jgi:hypothetical protein